MFAAFKRICFVPSARTLAQRELDEAQRELLKAQSSADLARVHVVYHQDRIKRLKTYLKTETEGNNE